MVGEGQSVYDTAINYNTSQVETDFELLNTNDGGGLYYSAGYSDSSVSGIKFGHLIKFDSDGELEWELNRFHRETIYGQSNLVVRCYHGSHTNSIYITNSYKKDSFEVIRLDYDGNILWVKEFRQFITSGTWEDYQALVESEGGKIYVAVGGYVKDSIELTKLDTAGNLIWQKYLDGTGYKSPYPQELFMKDETTIHLFIQSDLSGNLLIAELDSSANFIKKKGISFVNGKYVGKGSRGPKKYIIHQYADKSYTAITCNDDSVFCKKFGSNLKTTWKKTFFYNPYIARQTFGDFIPLGDTGFVLVMGATLGPNVDSVRIDIYDSARVLQKYGYQHVEDWWGNRGIVPLSARVVGGKLVIAGTVGSLGAGIKGQYLMVDTTVFGGKGLVSSVSHLAIETHDFCLYPNPANTHLTIESDDFHFGKAILKLFNVEGKQFDVTIHSRSNNKICIEINDLPTGIYQIEFINEGRVESQKFIRL